MAQITGITAAYMAQLMAGNIRGAYIDVGGNLIFIDYLGEESSAGQVVGPKVGGDAGAVFAKNSGADYDADWTSELSISQVLLTSPVENWLDLGIQLIGDPYLRVMLKSNLFRMADGKRDPYLESHPVGATGSGTDNQVFIEGLSHVANLFHLHAARPGTIALEAPAVDGTPTMPMTAGTVVVDNAAELPSTSVGPSGTSRAFLLQPTFNDAFDRSNSTTSAGSGYTAQGGSVWGVNSGQLYCVSGGTVSRLTRETLAERHRISVKISGTAAHVNGAGILFSYIDASNFIYVKYNNALDVWETYEVVAGVETQIFTSRQGLGANIMLTAQYKDGIISVRFGDNPPVRVASSVAEGTKVGFLTPNGGPAGATLRWDDLVVEGEYVASWTGKSTNDLTGFTASDAPAGAINELWSVFYEDSAPRVLVRLSDRYGSPVGQIYENGEVKLTNNIRLVSEDGRSEATFGMISIDPEGMVEAPPGSLRTTEGGVLWIKKENDDDEGWAKVLDESLPIDVIFARYTASHVLDLTDHGKTIEMNSAGANDLEVPPNSLVPFPIGTVLPVIQRGTGLTSILEGAGVTVNSLGGDLDSAGQFARFTLAKVDDDEWYLDGQIA